MKPTAFVKVSGDLFISSGSLKILEELSKLHTLIICVGGGKQINRVFEDMGLELTKYKPLGRELHSLQERLLARNILDENKSLLHKKLAELNISATVIIPVLNIGSVLCHVNGDQMVRTAYIGFDKLFVITTPDRKEKKEKDFAELLISAGGKVEILAVDPD